METEDKPANICPVKACEWERFIENQEKLIDQMATIQKYLFAGRVVMSVIVGIALTFDWLRDHAAMFKNWIK